MKYFTSATLKHNDSFESQKGAESELGVLDVVCPQILDRHRFQAVQEGIVVQAVHLF